MNKYSALQHHLTDLAAQGQSDITCSFKEIENIIGTPLPKSAHNHRPWWANNPTGHSHSLAWIHAGWQTRDVDMNSKKLKFVRESHPSYNGGHDEPPPSPFGALAGTVTIHDAAALTQPSGERWAAEGDAP